MLKNRLKRKAGLTLAELLVSMFIMGTMIGVVVYNHINFTDNLEITNLAYAVALSIREAQVSGVSVKVNPENNFDAAFGVHFNISNSLNFQGNNMKFLTFADLDQEGESGYHEYSQTGASYPGFDCDDPNNDECVSVTEIGRNNYIYAICYRGTGANMTCLPSIKGVDITFLRPKPDAFTRFRNSGGSGVIAHDKKEAIICLKSPKGRIKSVHVLKTGQISVRSEECVPQGLGS